MAKIKNLNYRAFLDTGVIRYLNIHRFKRLLDNVKGIHGRYIQEGRALLIFLYYTAARPAEALEMYQGDIIEDGIHVVATIPTMKRGVKRKLWIRKERPFVEEMFKFCWNMFPGLKIFRNYESKYVKPYKAHNGEIRWYTETTGRLRYHFRKWSESALNGGITPYFLRHNRMSRLSERGASLQELKYFKGSKYTASVEPYLHVSAAIGKKIAKIND